MKFDGKVCTTLNNVLQKVTILLLTTYTILPEPPQQSGSTLIVYCILCKYVIVVWVGAYRSYKHTYYYVLFLLLFLHHDVRMYDFLYGSIVPEINYSIK